MVTGGKQQKGLKMLIDTSREEIYMTINQSDENVSYKETTLDKNNFMALRIVYGEVYLSN